MSSEQPCQAQIEAGIIAAERHAQGRNTDFEMQEWYQWFIDKPQPLSHAQINTLGRAVTYVAFVGRVRDFLVLRWLRRKVTP